MAASEWPLPALHSGGWVAVVGFGALSIRDRGVWRRLLDAESPDILVQEIVIADPTDWDSIRATTAPSMRESLNLITPPSELESLALEPPDGTAIALVLNNHQILLGYQGVPNEDAWQAFLDAIQTRGTVS